MATIKKGILGGVSGKVGNVVGGNWKGVDYLRSLPAEVRLYDHLFTNQNPDDVPEGKDFTSNLNPNSLEALKDCRVEPSLANAKPLSRFQFERLGYFCIDPDSKEGKLVFNRTVNLRDEWAKIQKAEK